MVPLFAVQVILDFNISEEMDIYKEKTERKTIEGTRKLLGVMKGKKIFLYTPIIGWYLEHGLRLTEIHQLVEYEPDNSISWFSEEVANARRRANKVSFKNNWVKSQNQR